MEVVVVLAQQHLDAGSLLLRLDHELHVRGPVEYGDLLLAATLGGTASDLTGCQWISAL